MQENSPDKPITSKDNSAIQRLRALSDPKYRKQEKAFLIEGIKMVEEALRDDLGVLMVAAAPSLTRHHGMGIIRLAESRGVRLLWISERLMDALADSKTPQPVMAVVAMRKHSEEELLAHPARLIVIAHRLQDPGNLGTMIRTAEAAGASGIALSKQTVDPFNAKSVRASMGSILRLPIVHGVDSGSFIEQCRRRGFQTAAAVLNGEKTHFDVDLTKPTALVFGQEGAGLPQDLLSGIDLQVRIPMAATIDSLNVAASAAVVLYEAMRQRRLKEMASRE